MNSGLVGDFHSPQVPALHTLTDTRQLSDEREPVRYVMHELGESRVVVVMKLYNPNIHTA